MSADENLPTDVVFLEGQAFFAPTEIAWAGLQDLHRRALGETDGFTLEGLGEFSPVSAFDTYERSTAAVLAQIGVSAPEFSSHVVDSIDAFVRQSGTLEGLEGPLLSGMFGAAANDFDTGATDQVASLVREFGLGDHIAGGRDAAHVLDRTIGQLGELGREQIGNVVERAAQGGIEQARGVIDTMTGADRPDRPDSSDRPAAGDHHSSGGGVGSFFLGLFEIAVAAVVAAVNPPAAVELAAIGFGTAARGLGDMLKPGESAETHIHTTKETVHKTEVHHPDGTVVKTETKTYETREVHIGAKGGSSPHSDSGDSSMPADDTGLDPWTGSPIPINPCAVAMCPPGDIDGTVFDIGGKWSHIELPHVDVDGSMIDAGPLTYYADLDDVIDSATQDWTVESRSSQGLASRVRKTGNRVEFTGPEDAVWVTNYEELTAPRGVVELTNLATREVVTLNAAQREDQITVAPSARSLEREWRHYWRSIGA
jgi:hypothetical protein